MLDQSPMLIKNDQISGIDPACPVILSVMFSLYREEAVCEALSICSQSDLDAIREHFSFIGADYDDWKEWC